MTPNFFYRAMHYSA